MEDNNKTITTLHDLLDYEARKFCSAEALLNNSLNVWKEKANSLKFKSVLQKYHLMVEDHIKKINDFFIDENISSVCLHNRVMEAFVLETNEQIMACTDLEVMDACLLACIQSINHYKISTYGTAATFANAIGNEKAALLFHEAEVNEKQVDDRLSQLAIHEINSKANAPIALKNAP
jgi:ferritin-like metal-binding protein YciE